MSSQVGVYNAALIESGSRYWQKVQHGSEDETMNETMNMKCEGRGLNALHIALHIAAVTAVLSAALSLPASAQVTIQFAVPGIVVDVGDPYFYSPRPCPGCWYGEWGGRTGYHRGGGRPWEREHSEADHHGREERRDNHHEGHR